LWLFEENKFPLPQNSKHFENISKFSPLFLKKMLKTKKRKKKEMGKLPV